ncbi:hypothetical protein C0J52_01375 [Blattella germanica]|nr:hypothetical protein C0J52_01375 [Blattella germanica]
MESGKRYTQTVERAFHVSMACLEPNTADTENVSVMLVFDNKEFILCNLNKNKAIQAHLDLNFQSGDRIAFMSTGKGRVHLTGYLLETDEEEDDEAAVMDMDLSDFDKLNSPVKGTGKRKNEPQLKKVESKKAKIEAENEGDEVEVSPKPKTPDLKKKDKLHQMKSPEDRNKTPADQKQKNKSLIEKQQKNKTPGDKQKNKTPNAQGQNTPNQKSPGNQMNSGKKNKKGQETPKGPKTPGGESPQKRVLEGGVVVEELKVGNGPVAKPGRQVSVYYVGRLKNNNKQFDSTTEGSGFKFRLGRGEVIKGWDIGVNGMKVGGKRKIVCPAALAYGNKGSPPAIPPNSTLVFDVELKAVN